LEKEKRTYTFLDNLGLSYQRIDHEAAMTMEACAEIDKALGGTICKNLLLCNRQQTDFYLLMMPGEKSFRTSEFSKLMGTSRLSFAPGEFMEALLDITPGSLSVLGLMNDQENKVQLVIDQDVLESESFGCHPCVNTSSLLLRTADLMEKLLPAMHHEAVIVSL
jgi:Ala-tRNA(Pro) deacylase